MTLLDQVVMYVTVFLFVIASPVSSQNMPIYLTGNDDEFNRTVNSSTVTDSERNTEDEINFTYIPSFGSHDDLCGWVCCIDPNSYKVAVYIYVSGWWSKPTWEESLTSITNDGTWNCDITTGGIDQYATKIIAFLVPNEYKPPLGKGQQCLNDELYQYPHIEIIRYKKISFSGYDWWIKRHNERVGPGPNYFSDSEKNVWIDPNGYLHLGIVQKDEKWFCSEVIADTSFGYGTYIFTIQGSVDLLDENVVLGLFTWEDCIPQHHYREIDIEFSRWGQTENKNAQYVVQPWGIQGNMHRFEIDLASNLNKMTTHVLTWSPDQICFLSYHGDFSLIPSITNMIASWSYTGNDIPPAGSENPRINFWLMNGNAPNSGQNTQIIIKAFRYLPDRIASINFIDFAWFATHWLESEYNSCADVDLNNDDDIDFSDLDLFTKNWLEDYLP